MNNFFKKLLLSIIFLSPFAISFTHCMLNNIKDTDSILHADYNYLSLVHGAIAWETGVIRRLYDFGQIFPVYKQDKQGRKIIENYDNPDQTHKMVRLIHAFFYRVPGSTGEADFGATTQLANDDPVVTVKLIADILVQCEQLQQQRGQFDDAVTYVQDLIAVIADGDWLGKLGPKITRKILEQKIKDDQEKPWNAQVATAFVSMCKLFEKNLAKELGEKVLQELGLHRQAAEKFFGMITEVTKTLRKLFKLEVFKKRENVESFIVEALNECNPNNPDALYPEHMVEMILLAFVYKKYSYNRNVLKAFYDALNEQFGGKLLVRELDEQWVKDSFASVTQDQALKTIETIFSSEDLMRSIKQHFAEFVYNAFQIRSFPAPVGYEIATYEYGENKKRAGFTDCMDNTMRNFINLYAYDAENNKFTLEKLLTNMSIANVYMGLADFLKMFGEVNKASSLEAHNAWAQMISNLPYFAYNHMVDGVTGESTRALETSKGYIIIPDNERSNELLNWLKTNGYQVLEKNQYGYELQPSVKNIIIVLDHLLALNLFSNAGDLAKEFVRPDFIKEYFPKLCAKIKATGFLSTNQNSQEGESDKDFDALDYTEFNIYTILELGEIICEFKIYSGHGELQLITAQEPSGLNELLQKINNFSGQSSLSLLVTNLLCKQGVNFYHLKSNLEYLYINTFAIPLENTGLFASRRMESIFSIVVDATPLKIKIGIKDLLLRRAEKQPDVEQQQTQKINSLKFFIEKLSSDDIQNGGITVANFLVEAPQIAAKGIASQGYHVRRVSLGLFNLLLEKNQAFAEAIKTAEKAIKDPDAYARVVALELFNSLVKKDQGFTEALQAAQKGIVDLDAEVRNEAQLLFKQLIIKVPDETKKAVQEFLDDSEFNVIDYSGENVTKEVKKGLCELLGQTEEFCIIF
jgi:hypothetical protein